jgi:ergothioneine biosynthesis protein EgtB
MEVQTPTVVPALEQYRACRSFTEKLCKPLEIEDYVVQSMTDASPTKWHLAHTTWFFETFVLVEFDPGYCRFDERFPYLFNSYYIQAGERYTRADRGRITRPTVAEVHAYRRHVDEHMFRLLEHLEEQREAESREAIRVTTIGVNHEQQHQELLLTDLRHLLSFNPLHPAYSGKKLPVSAPAGPPEWHRIEEGVYEIGTDDALFFYDNEGPRHRYFIEPFELASRPVTNGEFMSFIADGGYRNPLLWLSEGWATAEAEGWDRPLYWSNDSGTWKEFTLHGLTDLDPDAPVSAVSYFEADAYARWAGARLPSEFEWEVAASQADIAGVFADDMIFQPHNGGSLISHPFRHLFGNVWEWTRSQYSPYPGYRPDEGALGEYNGKFMSNQFVLRGGSCATSRSHIRKTYRNFFPASARWQFSGIRLARDV